MRKSIHEIPATFVIGFSDGLVLPMAVITALRFTGTDLAVWKPGLIFILLYALVMGLSYHLTRKTHQDTTIKRETFENIGLSPELEAQLLEDLRQEQQEWQEVLMEDDFLKSGGTAHSFTIFLAYFLSGLCLLLPFLFLEKPVAYIISCIICLLLMAVSGAFKAGIVGNTVLRVILKGWFHAALLSAMAYGLTWLFSGFQ
ncbi:MAG TPA: VIT1/CCC1 transporter family protein [Flavipsychrobacter sp.]|nr:VIT1/CCC1 transporter family protein [Flavipsychrobacter sp.]